MCGIAGWVGPARSPDALAPMMAQIAHRGPDGAGQVVLPCGNGVEAVFGHKRLSILDQGGGHQPMQSGSGRLTVSYNGEIYNYIELREALRSAGHVFVTGSDTEVLLAAWDEWGPEALARLRGMFAFALHDAADGSVYFARDGFGKKPLFLTQVEDSWVFGSEIPALLAHPSVRQELDEASLHEFLCWRYVPAPHTFFKGIQKLMPGHLAVLKDGHLEQHAYFTPPEMTGVALDHSSPVERFKAIFDEAVAIRLRSDVPVGMFLSSGIDSAAVLDSVCRAGGRVTAYSVGYSEAQMSELETAGALAARFGTPFEPIMLDADGLMARIERMTRHRSAPVSEAADVPVFAMSERAGQDVKVVLTGEGADEFFAGYPKHVMEAKLGSSSRFMAPVGHAMRLTRHRRLKLAGRALSARSFEARMIQWFGGVSAEERAAMWRGRAVHRQQDKTPFLRRGASPLRRVLHFDQTSWLPDNVLERGDRMSMAASIELRAPFMDTELAAFSATLPDHWRIKGRVTKRVLREAMADRLPSEVLTRKKMGFPVPVSAWFRGDLAEPLASRLGNKNAIIANYVDPAWIARTVKAHRNGDSSKDKLLWMLFAAETFLQSYFGDGP